MRKLTYRFVTIPWSSDIDMTVTINSLVFDNERVISTEAGEDGVQVLVERVEPEIRH